VTLFFDEAWTAGPIGDWAPHGEHNQWRGEGAHNQYWQDALIPIEPGESVFEYDDPSNSPGREGSTAMVQYVDPQDHFRTVFSAIGFEGMQQRYWDRPGWGIISRVHRSHLYHNIGDFLRTGTVVGELRYRQPAGQPVEGAAVELIDDWGPSPTYGEVIGSGISRADGSWMIEGVVATIFLLRITHEQQIVYYHPERTSACGGFITDIGMITLTKPAPGTISGRVLELDGRTGIPGATVTFTSDEGVEYPPATTAIDGTYSVQVSPGTYTGVASKEDYASATRTGIVVMEGEATRRINFILGVPGDIAGTVTSADTGDPIANALVELFIGGVRIASTHTGTGEGDLELGAYLIEDIAAGSYDMRASAAGFDSQNRSGVVVIANQTTTVNFQLPLPPPPDEYHRYEAGRIYLMSMPNNFTAYDAADVLHYTPQLTAVSLVTYMPSLGGYVFYPTPLANRFFPGRGYWLMTDGEARITEETPWTQSPGMEYDVTVQAGWNMIGNPFPESTGVAWADVKVTVDAITEYPVGLAADLGYIRRTLWGWSGTGYVQSTRLWPWEGYWMYAEQACQLIIPRSGPPLPP